MCAWLVQNIYTFTFISNNIIILIYIAYHCKCIDPWLTRNRRFCPICKRRVYGNNEDLHAVAYSSDTDSDEPNDRTPLVPSHVNNSNSLGVGTFRSFRVSIFYRFLGFGYIQILI